MGDEGPCETCFRLKLECLGFGAKRPEWLRASSVSYSHSSVLTYNTFLHRRLLVSPKFVIRLKPISLHRG